MRGEGEVKKGRRETLGGGKNTFKILQPPLFKPLLFWLARDSRISKFISQLQCKIARKIEAIFHIVCHLIGAQNRLEIIGAKKRDRKKPVGKRDIKRQEIHIKPYCGGESYGAK